MQRFWIAVWALSLIAHAPFGAGLAFGLARLGVPFAGWFALLIAAALLALLPGRIAHARWDRHIPAWKVVLLEEPWYAHWCAAVAALPLVVVSGAGVLLHAAVRGSAGLGAQLGAAALASYGAALALCVYGVMIRRRWVRVRTIDVPIAGLGERFDGYRIAHLSDLHIGTFRSRAAASRWCRVVERLDVDLVALTGDYLTMGDAFHEDVVAILSSLKARDGAAAVLGNHDFFGDTKAFVERLRAGGITVLRNEHVAITRGEEAITLAGVDDTWTRNADPERALAGAPGGRPVIVLAHDPQLFPVLARKGVHLVLSGHTHWGQIAVPFWPERFNLSRLTYRIHAGHHRDGEATLYVSPGLGTTGPPVRIGAPPEITVLRLLRRERA
jgi:hypothetical protein